METIPLHAEASRDRLYIDPSPEGLAHAEKLGATYDPVARRYFVPPSLDQAAARELVHSYGTAEARLASSSRVETLAAQRAELGQAARAAAAAMGAPVAGTAVVSREAADQALQRVTSQLDRQEDKQGRVPGERPAEYNSVLQALADILCETPVRVAGRYVDRAISRMEKGATQPPREDSHRQAASHVAYSLGDDSAAAGAKQQSKAAEAPPAQKQQGEQPITLAANDRAGVVQLREELLTYSNEAVRRQELVQVAEIQRIWGNRLKLDGESARLEQDIVRALGIVRQEMAERGMLDSGKQSVGQKIEAQFRRELAQRQPPASSRSPDMGMG